MLGAFARNARGNVAIIFALSLVPMIGLLGLGVDYAGGLRAKSALDASADAAALAAVTLASQVISAQSTSNVDATNQAIAQGTYGAQLVFNANAGAFLARTNPQMSVSVARNGMILTATVNYTATSPNVFGAMFGTNRLGIAGHAVSTTTMPKYINVYVAIDVSQSMGIAATNAAMSQLYTLTAQTPLQGGGCVFGCHVATGTQTISNEQLAHDHGIQLRIDVIQQSTINMIQTAQSMSSGVPLIQFGLYTIQYGLNTLATPSSNYPALLNTAAQIDLGPNTASGVGDSNDANALTALAALVPASGDGSGPNSPQTFVFIMTDGVSDVFGSSCSFGHCTQAFDPSLCQPFRSRGATVGVIYTTYLPIFNTGIDPTSGYDFRYQGLVAPLASQIAPNLQSCASTGYYYEASDGPAIAQAVQRLFASATTSARLSQ